MKLTVALGSVWVHNRSDSYCTGFSLICVWSKSVLFIGPEATCMSNTPPYKIHYMASNSTQLQIPNQTRHSGEFYLLQSQCPRNDNRQRSLQRIARRHKLIWQVIKCSDLLQFWTHHRKLVCDSCCSGWLGGVEGKGGGLGCGWGGGSEALVQICTCVSNRKCTFSAAL